VGVEDESAIGWRYCDRAKKKRYTITAMTEAERESLRI
jgi:hypothetical protein